MSRKFLIAAAVLMFGMSTQAGAVTVSLERRTVTNEAALAMIGACKAMAKKNNWNLAIAVVDHAGNLVAYERMDGASVIATQAAPLKAKTSVRWRRPSKVIAERFAQGSEEAIWLGDFAVQGGLPIIVEGKAIGAIAAGGAMSAQDEECALEGLKAVLGPNPAMQETR
jgi:glc operon protein GlcG